MNPEHRTEKLFLFTNFFPYGNDEVFVENEIMAICSLFEEVHLFPALEGKSKREIPINVKVWTIHQKISGSSFALLLIYFPVIFKIILQEIRISGLRIAAKYCMRNLGAIFHALRLSIYVEKNVQDSATPEKLFYSYWMNEWALALAFLKYRKKINRFIFRVHGYDLYDPLRPDAYIPFRKFIMGNCENVYTVCKASEEYLKTRNIHPEKIKLSHLGVFDRGLNPFNLNSVFTLVSCSSLNTHKRVDKIVDSLSLLNFPIRWVHFGGKGDRLNVEDFGKLCNKLPSNIKWDLRGYVPNDEIIKYYKENSINLFIHLTFTEGGVPVVLQEAASFGIPLMSTNTGGVSEIVNSATGILLDHELDIKIVAEQISLFRNSSMNEVDFRLNVKNFWKDNFNAAVNYKRFYESIALP